MDRVLSIAVRQPPTIFGGSTYALESSTPTVPNGL
ncbi:hypothetical protein P3T40_004316 [Paraburkholderia sp. EB58]|jgi:hypothetical protein